MTVVLLVLACATENIRTDETPAEYAVRLADNGDATHLVEQLNHLEETRGQDYAIDAGDLIWAGYEQLMLGRIEEALVIQQAATTLFPSSSRAWENLGETAIYFGDRELALTSLERAMELDSTSSARWMLDDVDREMREAAAETSVMNLYEPGEQTDLVGPYFGLAEPGVEPEVFAPGIVSTRGGHEFSVAFSPDGREVYFNRGPNIHVAYWREEGWTAPALAPFNSDRLDHEPFIPADGSKLFFGSGRARAGVADAEAYGIWVMERSGDGWGPPEYLFQGMYVTTSVGGNAYVTDINYSVGGGLCVYRWWDGEYQECSRLTGGVNDIEAAHPLIAPDESFLIFDGNDDFYISFPLGNGSWSAGTRIAEISTPGANMTASLSPDGRFLFYYANHDIYWVRAEILQPYVIAFLAGAQR